MKGIAIAIAACACAAAAPAWAAPVYMTCEFTNTEGAKSEVRFTADEEAGTVTLFVPKTGHTERMVGAFTPEQVVFKGGMLDYTISRVDLSATRTIRMISSTEQGKCKVDQAPKRAF